MLRHGNYDENNFFSCLKYIEMSLSDIIFRKGSFFKFIFQDNKDNWFSLSYNNDNCVKPCLLDIGPWSFNNEL